MLDTQVNMECRTRAGEAPAFVPCQIDGFATALCMGRGGIGRNGDSGARRGVEAGCRNNKVRGERRLGRSLGFGATCVGGDASSGR